MARRAAAAAAVLAAAACASPPPASGPTRADAARCAQRMAARMQAEPDAPRLSALCPAAAAQAVRLIYDVLDDRYAAAAAAARRAAGATPSAAALARNFERIALRRETEPGRAATDANTEPTPLNRFDGPIRYHIDAAALGGAALAADVAAFAPRLQALTGVPWRAAAREADANVLIVSVPWDDRLAVADAFARAAEGRVPFLDAWVDSLSSPCFVAPTVDEASGALSGGVVFLAAELGPVLRDSCVHEELAQLMGLPGDHPDARPSAFNDDEVFVYVTRQDELLLRMLYDPRLARGMTWTEAEPIVRRIAQELTRRG